MKRKLVLAGAPQPEVLRDYLENASVAHGHTITGNLKNVRLEKQTNRTVSMFFCPMKGVEVTRKMGTADGSDIPETVELHGTMKTTKGIKDGYYNLYNVQIHANGAMHVTVGIDSQLELVEAMER